MAKARSLVGLDVHATKIIAATLGAETGELATFAMGGESKAAAAFCAGLPRPVRVAYEAGPTGYGLARELARRLSVWSRRRARSRARPGTGSRPTAGTRSISCGCCWRASCTRSGGGPATRGEPATEL